MAGYNPAGPVAAPNNYWDRFFETLRWLREDATDDQYWYFYKTVGGWPVPKRPQDSWWDRFKARHF